MQGASRKIYVLFGLAFAFVVAGASWTYRLQRESLREHVVARLAAISRLKIERLADWRQDRLVDATLLVSAPRFAETAKAWLSTGQERDRAKLLSTLRGLASYKDCDDVMLTRDDGSVALSVSGYAAALSTGERSAPHAALRQRRPSFADEATSQPAETPRANVVAPIFEDADASHPAVAALVLRTNAASALAGLMRHWPAPDATGDFVLAQRDGDDALVLGPLRMHDGAPRTLRMPLGQTTRPAVTAVEGLRGAFEGQDYRGADVIAVLDAIPDSPWVLVTKLDHPTGGADPARLEACAACDLATVVRAALGGDGAQRDCTLEIEDPSDPRGARRTLRIGAGAMQTDGPPRAVVALWDITEQQRAAEARRALEAQLAEAMRKPFASHALVDAVRQVLREGDERAPDPVGGAAG